MMITVAFGSARRGDYDSFSDKDMLIIGADWSDLSNAKLEKRSQGYSVTCFTIDKAKYLISAGSLFFKHIGDEGALLEGSHAEYDQLISGWKPAVSYNEEIEENLELLDVLEFTPRSTLGVAVALDIIITVMRSVLIRELAQYGLYVFSWERIMEQAEILGLIKPNDKMIFLQARKLKSAYRCGGIPKISKGFFAALAESAFRSLGKTNSVRFSTRSRIYKLPDRFVDNSYKQLRALELLCAEYAADPSLEAIKECVKDPNYFCFRFRTKLNPARLP